MREFPATKARLELAAEQTIGAAAAALLWAGPDKYGVLEHVASASAPGMAQSRWTYWFLESCRSACEPEEREAFDESLAGVVSLSNFEVAALPGSAVPAWVDAIERTLRDISDESLASAHSDDAVARRLIFALSVRRHALTACSSWAWDTLPLNRIEVAAHIVRRQTEHTSNERF